MRMIVLLALVPAALLAGCGPSRSAGERDVDLWCHPDPKSPLCEQARWRKAQCEADPQGIACIEAKQLLKQQQEAARQWEEMDR